MADAAQQALSSPKAYHWRESAPKRTPAAARKRLLELIDSGNIAEEMGEEELGRLGMKIQREFDVDWSSLSDWREANEEAMKLARQVAEEKNFPWPKAANIQYPLLTVAAIQFAARAYPAIINGPNVVKGRVRGKDDGIPLEQPAGPPGMGQPGQQSGPQAAPQPYQIPQGPPIEAGQPMATLPEGIGPPPPEGMGAQPSAGLQGQPGQEPFSGPQAAPGMPQQGQQQPPEQQWQVEPGAKKKRADRVARHMSYQLLDEMDEWEEDTDRLLHVLPIVGCVFRKTYFSPALGRNISALVLPGDFVVHAKTKSLNACPRATHVITLHPYEIEERIRDGRFIDFDYGKPAGTEPDDDESPHEFLEQHRLEDLDEDGYPEPYIVTVHKETSKTVRIVARFNEDSVKVGDDGRVRRIEGEVFFTKFSFIPAFDGSFYDIGFGSLLRGMSKAINGAINRMLDAGTLENMGGGFIGAGMRIRGGDQRFRPGEWKRIMSVGGSIRDNIVPLPVAGPSATLFQLLGLLIEASRDITSVKDVMTGDEGPPGEGEGRTLARIEQGMKVFSAIYKRLFRSFKSEFKKLFRLNGLYLDQETYFTLHDDPEAIGPDDYNADDLDILPVADPNMVTERQKLSQAQFIDANKDDRYYDPLEARRRVLSAAGVTDVDELLIEQPSPDPRLLQSADEIDIKKKELEIKKQQLGFDEMKARAESEKAMAQIAEIQSKVILNLAKADEASDKVQIEALKVQIDGMLEQGRQRLEIGRAMDAREANERKSEIDGRKINTAGANV